MINGQQNITKKEMTLRIIAGLVCLGIGMAKKDFLGNSSGIFLLGSGLIEWCPFYFLFKKIMKRKFRFSNLFRIKIFINQ